MRRIDLQSVGIRKKRHKDFLLPKEKIPGIGEIKRKRLLQKFKSWEQVMKASQGELEAIPGLTKKEHSTFVG